VIPTVLELLKRCDYPGMGSVRFIEQGTGREFTKAGWRLHTGLYRSYNISIGPQDRGTGGTRSERVGHDVYLLSDGTIVAADNGYGGLWPPRRFSLSESQGVARGNGPGPYGTDTTQSGHVELCRLYNMAVSTGRQPGLTSMQSSVTHEIPDLYGYMRQGRR
jgi:hypothetical protein